MVIEWAMLFTLGALVASLLWLGALPVVSRRALRLATARLSQQVPLSPAEIGAERDQLRAVHAVALRRMEQAAEASEARLAAAMAESGRHLARIAALETRAGVSQAEQARLEAELQAATRAGEEARRGLETQTAALREALAVAARRGALVTATEALLATQTAAADERGTRIAELETRAAEQDARLRDALALTAELGERLAAAEAAVDASHVARTDALLRSAGREAAEASVDAMTTEIGLLRDSQAQAAQAARKAEKRAQLQSETINGLADRILAQDDDLAALRQKLDEANARRDGERARLLADRSGADAEGGDREARLRAAVASLAADLVAFAGEGRPPTDSATPGP